jgi:hypothetical protein
MRGRSTDNTVGQRDLQDSGHGTCTTTMKQMPARLSSDAKLDFINHGEERWMYLACQSQDCADLIVYSKRLAAA